MTAETRNRLSIVLIGAAAIVSALALIAGYVLHVGVNSDEFANRATEALSDESVNNLVARKITDDVVLRHDENLLAARPLIESVAGEIVGSRPFTALFRIGVGNVHRALFAGARGTVTLRVSDVGALLEAALEELNPSLASKLDFQGKVEIVQREVGNVGSDLAHFADSVRMLVWILVAVWLVLIGTALYLAPDRRVAVSRIGVATAVAGGLIVVIYAITRSIAINDVDGPEAQAAAAAVWDAFLGDLRTEGWILAGAGVVVAAASASLIRPPELGGPMRRLARRLAAEPTSRGARGIRAAGLIVLGLIVLTQPDAVVQLLVTVVGLYLVYEGVAAGLKLINRPRPVAREFLGDRVEGEPEELFAPKRRQYLIAGGVSVALVAAVLLVFLGSGSASTAPPSTGACEGNRELCDRSLEEVALPATHNAMSVPLPGWYSAEQDAPIADQLADGIRGLLIDTHYGDLLSNGKVRTEISSKKITKEDAVSQDAIDRATRIREGAVYGGEGDRGMYLCHTFCELGATSLQSVLDDIHDFLVTHPDDVLVVINQDYVEPADFVEAVEQAGLADMAYSGPTGIGEWPTLQEMIDSNQRVVFLAEHDAGGAPWYHKAYESITEETPYTFKTSSDLTDPDQVEQSCKANRGPAKAPLFLVNHWVSTDPVPKTSDAEKINAYEPLLHRVETCERRRDHVANLVAVNFYRRGDLFQVVNTLNGLPPDG
jgi:hypothetical protein